MVGGPVVLWLVRRWPCGWCAGCLVVGAPVALWLVRRLPCGWCASGLVVDAPVALWLGFRWPCSWCAIGLVVGAPVALWLVHPWPCAWAHALAGVTVLSCWTNHKLSQGAWSRLSARGRERKYRSVPTPQLLGQNDKLLTVP